MDSDRRTITIAEAVCKIFIKNEIKIYVDIVSSDYL